MLPQQGRAVLASGVRTRVMRFGLTRALCPCFCGVSLSLWVWERLCKPSMVLGDPVCCAGFCLLPAVPCSHPIVRTPELTGLGPSRAAPALQRAPQALKDKVPQRLVASLISQSPKMMHGIVSFP